MGLADYYKQIADAQTKIEELRAKCEHRIFEVHMYMWRPGAMHPQRICTSCDAIVPGVTERETEQAWLDWNKGINTSSSPSNECVMFNLEKKDD
jgi:hypothetical protein